MLYVICIPDQMFYRIFIKTSTVHVHIHVVVITIIIVIIVVIVIVIQINININGYNCYKQRSHEAEQTEIEQ